MRRRGAGQFCTAAREKLLHRVLGCLTVFANDKAVYSSLSRKTEKSYTLEAISRQTQPLSSSRLIDSSHFVVVGISGFGAAEVACILQCSCRLNFSR